MYAYSIHQKTQLSTGIEEKSSFSSIFDLISRLFLITVRTYENQNAYQLFNVRYE